MPLEPPRLDDRKYGDLVNEALRRIPHFAPEWTDHNPSDPGVTLLELFAWMTDITLTRLNLVPDQHYIRLMQLLGMRLRESQPAHTEVTFWLTVPQDVDIAIPKGTQTATPRTETEESIIFTTLDILNVRVAELGEVLTSTLQEDREGGQVRVFKEQNLRRILSGFDGFYLFSDKPAEGDAFYLGFRRDLSYNILGLLVDVDIASGAGIDPLNPPYVWQALGGSPTSPEWNDCEVERDDTKGFNVPGMMQMHLPKMTMGEIDGRRAYWVRCRLITPEVGTQYQSSPLVRKMETGSWGGTVKSMHAISVYNEVLGRSEGTPGQRFYLTNAPLLAREKGDNIIVRTNDAEDEVWTEVLDFADSGPEDKHYILNSETGEIRFGPALPQPDGSIKRYGAIPHRKSAIVMKHYRYGGGTVGNIQRGALRVLISSIPYISRVVNRKPATGGLNMEDLEAAKLRVPGFLRSLHRAVTPKDYEYLTREAAGGAVARVYAIQPANVPAGTIQVLIIPAVTDPTGRVTPAELRLTQDLTDKIAQYLNERRLLTARMEVTAPAYYWVSVRVRAKINPNMDMNKAQETIENRLYQFLNPIVGGASGEGWEFGRDLYKSDIVAALQGLPGVEVVHEVELFPVTWGSGDKARRGEATETVEVIAHGVIASYRHEVKLEKYV
jgi:predicted phage baseplate assembly protein